eukprot:TRINITY_DN7249_c0_g3_i2.p1 TRINITY_DN7249_c0_g3~~TRINITY_DN7249_c0_g3_i2.p1  ORF type:complete len:726 (+),score=118.74 TRINITY_DN7249_c0_g3_i2:115-2292(+)
MFSLPHHIPPTSKPLSKEMSSADLKPILLREIVPGTTHRGRVLHCKVIETPVQSPNTHFIVEDDFEEVVLVGVYGDIGISPSLVAYFYRGRTLSIIEPFAKICPRGDIMIRIDNFTEILDCSFHIGAFKKSREWRELGDQLLKISPSVASECYSRSLISSTKPNEVSLAVLLSNRAASRLRSEDFSGAVLDAAVARVLDPFQTKAWFREASAFHGLGERMSALRTIEEAIKALPKGHSEPLKELRRCIEKEKDYRVSSKISRAWWEMSCLKLDEAVDFPDSSNSVLLMKEKGNDCFNKNDDVNAIFYYTLGIRMLAEDASLAASSIAVCAIQEKNYESAVIYSTISLVLNPQDENMWFDRGFSLVELGKKDLTQEIIEKFGTSRFKILEDKISLMDTDVPTLDKRPIFEYETLQENEMSTKALAFVNFFEMLSTNSIPPFHQTFPHQFGWPIGVDGKAGYKKLNNFWENFCSIKHMKHYYLSKHWKPSTTDLIKRMGANWEWYCDPSRKFGDVCEIPGELKYVGEILFHSFSNTPDFPQILHFGTTHIAVGFCDLGMLLTSVLTVHESNPNSVLKKPCVFVGVDMSAYAVAKFLVVNSMMKNGASTESIIEVWFSSTWTPGTYTEFMKALDTCRKKNTEKNVKLFLDYWKTSCMVPLQIAREKWLESSNVEIVNMKREKDIFATCNYFLTGDVLCRSELPECGNTTMFSIYPGKIFPFHQYFFHL